MKEDESRIYYVQTYQIDCMKHSWDIQVWKSIHRILGHPVFILSSMQICQLFRLLRRPLCRPWLGLGRPTSVGGDVNGNVDGRIKANDAGFASRDILSLRKYFLFNSLHHLPVHLRKPRPLVRSRPCLTVWPTAKAALSSGWWSTRSGKRSLWVHSGRI